MTEYPIDIVLPWVDGNDPEWQKEYSLYRPDTKFEPERYRDWGFLPYIFRGIEKYAPWVNKVFFVTNGQIPEWLNLDSPKLVFVKHSDYIPNKYLPTFNSNTIEYFFDRLPGLSEHFIVFNDDIFFINEVSPERFFQNGLPCDMAIETAYFAWPTGFNPFLYNIAAYVNKQFDKKQVLRNHFFKWFNLKYGMLLFKNMYFLGIPFFVSFKIFHFPQPLLKSVYKEVYDKYGAELEKTTCTRFRENSNITRLLISDWQLCSGKFQPYDIRKRSKYIQITDNNVEQCASMICSKKYSVICLNDNENIKNFETDKQRLIEAFQQILPTKSVYEK